jgi:hypothetical protein
VLGIYLNDHLAGATAGAELARRAAGSTQDREDHAALRGFAAEVAQDRVALLTSGSNRPGWTSSSHGPSARPSFSKTSGSGRPIRSSPWKRIPELPGTVTRWHAG